METRDDITVVPEVITWDICVARVTIGSSSFVVCMQGDEYDAWMHRFRAGELDAELRRVARDPPRRSLRSAPRGFRRAQRARCDRLGVEHEFEVHHREQRIDFRRMLPTLLTDRVRADPADHLATRMPWGVITADGMEAEIATAPVSTTPGFVGRALAAADDGHASLRAVCPTDHRLVGFSTHISVSWNVRRDDRLAVRWAQLFAPALMLLLDGPTSPGLIVRPRPGRLELCGDYATAQQLGAAVAFAAASVRTVQRISAREARRWSVEMTLQPALDRYGWYVDRSAFLGHDLYAHGHLTPLSRASTDISAGQHLDDMLALVLPDLASIGGRDDVEAVVAAVRSGAPPLLAMGRARG